jgi:hypothetical protein
MKAAKAAEDDVKGKKQTTLDENFAKMSSAQRKEFTKEAAVEAVAQLIVLDDQVMTGSSLWCSRLKLRRRLDIPLAACTREQGRFQELFSRYATSDEKL